MDQNLRCEVCDGTDFFKESGFYYCKECQTQSQQVQEHVFEQDAAIIDKKKSKKIQKDASKKEKDALTSWECYNIILKGLTEELVKCGAKPELKKVVKYLFMRYLHFTQVFQPKNDTAPCMNLFSSRHDIEVVYGIKKRKRKRSSSDSNSTISRVSSIRQRTKKKMALVQSQYELSQNLTQDSYLSETSLSELKSDKDKPEKPKKIRYNVATKKRLRKVMTSKHLKKHSTDFHKELTCHATKQERDRNRYLSSENKIQTLSVANLYHILYIGLLIIKDKMQLGDILRFIKEGHLSFGAYFHLFPEDCQEKKMFVPKITNKLSFREFKQKAADVVHFLKVEKYLETPDFMQLCERYLREMNLPQNILTYVEKIILVSDPKMNFTEKSKYIPNYEARALSFIIFTLKLFFGLDGKSEFKISEDSKNCQYSFDFQKWLTHIKYRKLVLERYHVPTTLENDCIELDSDMFLNYLKTHRLDYKHNKFKQLEVRDYYQVLEKIKEIPLGLRRYQTNQNFFEPSLTPFLSYISRIPTVPCHDLLQHDFCNESLNLVVNPNHYLSNLKNLDFGLNEKLVYENIFYCTKNYRHIRKKHKHVTVKISKEDIYNKEVKSTSTAKTIDIAKGTLKSWQWANKLTLYANRKHLEIPEETKTLPFERFWLNLPISPTRFVEYTNFEAKEIFEKLPFSFKIIIEESCRMLEQDFASFYSEYLQTECILVFREDLYSKSYNHLKSKRLKVALKECLQRW